MANVTTSGVSVRLQEEAAQALWAAMHEDDELAEDYVTIAVIHALNHLVEQVGPEHYDLVAWRKLRLNLKAARAAAREVEDEMTTRWMRYSEPPF